MKNLHEVMPYVLLDHISDFCGITRGDLLGRSRKKECVLGRFLTGYVFLSQGWCLGTTGLLINRDHSSISHYKTIILDGFDWVLNDRIAGFVVYLSERDIFLMELDEFKNKYT